MITRHTITVLILVVMTARCSIADSIPTPIWKIIDRQAPSTLRYDPIRRGESVDFCFQFLDNNTPVDLTHAYSAMLLYVPAGSTNAYAVEGDFLDRTNGTVSIPWRPLNEFAATNYVFDILISSASNTSKRAWGAFTLVTPAGYYLATNSLTPVTVIDFATARILNTGFAPFISSYDISDIRAFLSSIQSGSGSIDCQDLRVRGALDFTNWPGYLARTSQVPGSVSVVSGNNTSVSVSTNGNRIVFQVSCQAGGVSGGGIGSYTNTSINGVANSNSVYIADGQRSQWIRGTDGVWRISVDVSDVMSILTALVTATNGFYTTNNPAGFITLSQVPPDNVAWQSNAVDQIARQANASTSNAIQAAVGGCVPTNGILGMITNNTLTLAGFGSSAVNGPCVYYGTVNAYPAWTNGAILVFRDYTYGYMISTTNHITTYYYSGNLDPTATYGYRASGQLPIGSASLNTNIAPLVALSQFYPSKQDLSDCYAAQHNVNILTVTVSDASAPLRIRGSGSWMDIGRNVSGWSYIDAAGDILHLPSSIYFGTNNIFITPSGIWLGSNVFCNASGMYGCPSGADPAGAAQSVSNMLLSIIPTNAAGIAVLGGLTNMPLTWSAAGTNRLAWVVNGQTVGYIDTNGLTMLQGTLQLYQSDLNCNVRLYDGSRISPSITPAGHTNSCGLFIKGYNGSYSFAWSQSGNEIGVLSALGITLSSSNAAFNGKVIGDLSSCSNYPEPLCMALSTNTSFPMLSITNSGNLVMRDMGGTVRFQVIGSSGATTIQGVDTDVRYAVARTNMSGFIVTNLFANTTNIIWYSGQGIVTNHYP